MERRLQHLIENLEKISRDRGVSSDNPLVLRLRIAEQLTVVVLSVEEPHTLILPLNVTWINLDPTSNSFRRALKRVSKDDPQNGTHTHTWEVLHIYDDAFGHQFYDAADEAIITAGPSFGAATTTNMGLVRLSAEPTDSSAPIVVGSNDPRLSDARAPTAHTHPQEPAQSLATSTTNVIISGSVAPTVGSVLVAVSPTQAAWRPLTSADVQ